MRIALLGELEVWADDDTDVVVTGAKQRALLAMLALQPGRVVSTDQLVEALWGDDPPTAVRNGLQGLVSKLRRLLGSNELLAMRGGGYVLELPGEAIDVHRFERLVAEGLAAAAEDPVRSVDLLTQAEKLWRGDTVAELGYSDFASAIVTRLTELRVTAREERLHTELRLGRHASAIGELEAFVLEHPLRERPRGLLMLALYRTGRQADALRAYQDGRRLLADELGLEPGPELRQLEAAILAQDPSLHHPTSVIDTPGAPIEQRMQIPVSLTPLIGRDVELRELIGLIEDRRFVTLVGPGGVGKTRLALEMARVRSETLAFGGCLVELAPVGDPAGVRAAIASALDLPDPNQLAKLIGGREMLIVLDNCEHVIATAAEVAEDLLRRCPGLLLIATSREGLRVSGETIWPVPPLPSADAARLFIDRAQAAGARIELTADTVDVIEQICRRLDGLPLAIELAAARTRAFPVPQVLSRLNDRFRLLTGGSRTALPRQQTLRAVVDWSYELLFVDEQRLFERLSVFPGGCDLATAQAVCADGDLPSLDVEEIIRALIDKSLVVPMPSAGELRVTMLQTLAQYAHERLAERGDAARIRDAMAAHFSALCAESAEAFTGEGQRRWLAAMDVEHDNVRGALEWAVACGDAERSLTIAGGASWPHWLGGTLVEGKRWLDDAFACGGEASERTLALAWTGRALLHFQLGMPEGVDELLEAALRAFRHCGDRAGLSLAYSFYAEFPTVRGEIDEARRRRREVLALGESMPDGPFAYGTRAYSRAKLALLDGDLTEAERCYRLARDNFALLDRPVMSSMCLGMVADFDERKGDHRAAITALEAAIDTNRSLGLRGFLGALLDRLAWALLLDGDTPRAEHEYQRALGLGRRLDNTPVVLLALTGLAALHRLHGRDDEAVITATEALELHLSGRPRRLANRVDPQADISNGVAVCCRVLGAICADRGDAAGAALLLGQAERLRSEAGTSVPPFQDSDVQRAIEAAVATLGSEGFDAAYQRGLQGRLGHEVPVTR